jgi:hypothetical protein
VPVSLPGDSHRHNRVVATISRVRFWLILFVVGLLVSGVTAFPLESESRLLVNVLHGGWSPAPERLPALVHWLDRVHSGPADTNREYPFIAYGTDWLAFAHLVIAVAFWGPIKDPVRNIWVVQFGMIACVAVIPLALIAGSIRGIPWWWQLIDMSFGIFGIIPLLLAYREIRRLSSSMALVHCGCSSTPNWPSTINAHNAISASTSPHRG